jgi:hypothetical protein
MPVLRRMVRLMLMEMVRELLPSMTEGRETMKSSVQAKIR